MNEDSELFLEFALQCLKESFACFDFATRKFPQVALIDVRGAAAQQQAVVAGTDDRGNDVQRVCGLRRGARHAGIGRRRDVVTASCGTRR